MKQLPGILKLICIAAALGSQGCADALTFNAPSPLADGLRGKVWGGPVYLERNPNAVTTGSFVSFDIAASGSQAQLVTNLHDGTQYSPTARQYVRGQGWAAPGPFFQPLSATVSSAGVSVFPGAGGSFLAMFFNGATQDSYFFNGGSWQSQRTSSTVPSSFFSAGNPRVAEPSTAGAMDPYGRHWIAWRGVGNAAQVSRWEPASLTGIPSTSTGIPSTSEVAAQAMDDNSMSTYHLSLVSDGAGHMCEGRENGTAPARYLVVSCYDAWSGTVPMADISNGTASYPPIPPSILSVPRETYGHAMASNGEGLIMVVSQQVFSGEHRVMAHRVAYNGSVMAGSGPTTISSGMASGYQAISYNASTILGNAGTLNSAHRNGTRPQIVYLGFNTYTQQQLFLAAWVATTSATTAGKTALYSALYRRTLVAGSYVETGWDAPVMIGTAETFREIPHHLSFHLFTNGNLHAGIAVGHMKIELPASPQPVVASSSLTNVLLARYQADVGWTTPVERGSGCTASNKPCTHTPRGVVLDNGDAVAVFADMDGSGYHRLVSSEFK